MVMVFVGLLSVLSESVLFDYFISGISRFFLFFEVDKGESVNVRSHLISAAWNYISDAPVLGYGIGGFGIIVNGIDARAYPHNGFLEIWFEAGIFGVITFLILTLVSLSRAIRRGESQAAILLCFLMLNFMKSSSIDEMRLLFLVFGFIAGITMHVKHLEEKDN